MMTAPPRTHHEPTTRSLYGPVALRGRRYRPVRVLLLLLIVTALVAGLVVVATRIAAWRSDQAARTALAGQVWPAHGQAAFSTDRGDLRTGPNQHPAPIASVAKVMTAYLVLQEHPLRAGQPGPSLSLGAADVSDTARRRSQQESVIDVAAGERLTEQQALQALLLPSANNIAAVLARWVAGSEPAFVARMNATARSLGMRDTHYTDPSGFDAQTVSTAADQVRVVQAAMNLPVFAGIVATRTAVLPVAGLVQNTDSLLGTHGFVGVKTGSDDAAGGCFAFRSIRWINGRSTVITGVVLGQPGHNKLRAGLSAADAMVDRIAAGN
jgi:D-alanyl-D-alanine carboxypeptidase (penicillin-binding protein 5/6)